jgi:hypothetical protein
MLTMTRAGTSKSLAHCPSGGLRLDELQIWELYYTLLLKDLGCSRNAARICELYLVNDLEFKRDFKLIDGSMHQALRFVLSHRGIWAGLADRFRAIINLFQNGGEISTELIQTRCQRASRKARRQRLSQGTKGRGNCPGIAHSGGCRHLLRPDRRSPLPGRHAGIQGALDNG